MFNTIEINELKEDKKRGRLNITITALSIHERGQWNKRGMTWLEEYVQANIESAIGMPIVVSWLVDKEIPSDHGMYGFDDEGNRIFYDSDTVGSVQKAWIQEVEVDGIVGKKLVCSGYIFTQRYPKFVEWLKIQVANHEHVKGSVEVDGKGDSKEIIYETGNGHNPDGTWEMGRICKVFDFTGLAILSDIVKPADDGSEVIEINSLKESNSQINKTNHSDISDDIKQENKKEDINMAEINTDSVVELNNKIVSQATEINELKRQLCEANEELNKCKDELNACKKENEELNKCKEEMNACKEKETELNSLLVEANKTVESQKTQIAELNTEIEPLRKMKADAEAKEIQAEVNSYFEIIKKENGFTEAELNSLKTEYVDKCDLAGLKAKETELCVNKFKEMKRVDLANAELNSDDTKEDILFFTTKLETVEINNATDDGSDLFK